MQSFSVIIPVYRSSDSAKAILNRLEDAKLESLDEIIVVADEPFDGRWDSTKIIQNRERVGKAKAVNQGLEENSSEVVVLLSSDIDISPATIRKMAEKADSDSIIVTPCVLPFKVDSTPSRLSSTIWDIHRYLSLRSPKVGEAVAFKPAEMLPEEEIADEEWISSRKKERLFLENETVRNRPPESLKGLYIQRRRVFMGHIGLEVEEHYTAPSMKPLLLLEAVKDYLVYGGDPDSLLKAAVIECFARADGVLRYISGERPWKWKKVNTV